MPSESESSDNGTVELRRVAIADLNLDVNNANEGTERGEYMLAHSIETYGAGRSIVLDKNLNVIAGNKTLQKMAEMGATEILLVPNDSGNLLVGVLREDLDLYSDTDHRGRGLAYADNRVGQVNLRFSPAQVARDVAAGLDLSGLFFEDELDSYVARADDSEFIDMGAFGRVGPDSSAYRVIIEGLSYQEAEALRDTMPPELQARVEQYRSGG